MGALGNLPPPQSLGLPADTPPDIVRAALIAGYGVKAGASPFGDGSGQKQSTVSDQDLTLDRPGMKSGGSVAPFLGGHNFGNAHQHQQQHLQAQVPYKPVQLAFQKDMAFCIVLTFSCLSACACTRTDWIPGNRHELSSCSFCLSGFFVLRIFFVLPTSLPACLPVCLFVCTFACISLCVYMFSCVRACAGAGAIFEASAARRARAAP